MDVFKAANLAAARAAGGAAAGASLGALAAGMGRLGVRQSVKRRRDSSAPTWTTPAPESAGAPAGAPPGPKRSRDGDAPVLVHQEFSETAPMWIGVDGRKILLVAATSTERELSWAWGAQDYMVLESEQHRISRRGLPLRVLDEWTLGTVLREAGMGELVALRLQVGRQPLARLRLSKADALAMLIGVRGGPSAALRAQLLDATSVVPVDVCLALGARPGGLPVVRRHHLSQLAAERAPATSGAGCRLFGEPGTLGRVLMDYDATGRPSSAVVYCDAGEMLGATDAGVLETAMGVSNRTLLLDGRGGAAALLRHAAVYASSSLGLDVAVLDVDGEVCGGAIDTTGGSMGILGAARRRVVPPGASVAAAIAIETAHSPPDLLIISAVRDAKDVAAAKAAQDAGVALLLAPGSIPPTYLSELNSLAAPLQVLRI